MSHSRCKAAWSETQERCSNPDRRAVTRLHRFGHSPWLLLFLFPWVRHSIICVPKDYRSLAEVELRLPQVAFLVRMYQMQFHFVAFAVDRLFAWSMKVKLLECIFMSAHRDRTPWSVIDHDSVTVIDDVKRGRIVVELDRRQVGLFGRPDVDG